MFGLRFFAGPIVHKISPIGLLFGSAVLGATGLLLLGLPMTDTAVLWLLAVTVYGIGKTFYWPTMLGVISERFPRGGALALGISGGIGMISAGFLGGPIIGYQQDYAASSGLKQTSPAAYDRYKTDVPGTPLPGLPKIAGLDNAKLGVLSDKGEKLADDLKRDADNKNLTKLKKWWESEGEPNSADDKAKVGPARVEGGKKALFWTALVPTVMAGCYLLLMVFYTLTGGYKQIHLADDEVGPTEY
jgi:hypothetical protein